MAERPLLIFPMPAIASRTKRSGGRNSGVATSSPQQQWERLVPMFSELQDALDARRIEMQQSAAGTDPEQVLVMETVGSVEDFVNAVRRIDGLEWMGEVEIDEIAPDEEFYDESERDEAKREKMLSRRLYLVVTNQQALKQMLSLWKRYKEDTSMKFPHGLAKFREAFNLLNSIHKWGVQERLQDTRILDAWKKDLQMDGSRVVKFEAELWFRGNDERRAKSVGEVTALVQEQDGEILGESVISEIAYHGLLAELPAGAVRNIIKNPNTKLVKCDDVMFFRPTGQMVVGDKSPEGDAEIIPPPEEEQMPEGEPIVALFDGVPLANHNLLKGRLKLDDPDNWEADYLALDRNHGSSMASLIIRGDLNNAEKPLARPVYVRPIMKPLKGWPHSPKPERVPEDCLVIDLIHRAVKRLFDGEQGEAPEASQIKVINLSIGDPGRQFEQSMSPLARLLDWLSLKYRVLFIVSAGNHEGPIPLAMSEQEFTALGDDEREAAIVKALLRDIRNRRLLSPAETINGISVGAFHADNSQVGHQGNTIDPYVHPLPSPISAFGSGYRRAVKPDLIYYGGRQWYKRPLPSQPPVAIEPAGYVSPPGNKSASPGENANATAHSCGTSNATALVSRRAGICYDSLQQVFSEKRVEITPANCEVPLLKAMLVHGCSWGDTGDYLKSRIESSDIGQEIAGRASALYRRQADVSREIGRQYKSLLTRWMGYGLPKIERVLDCTDQRATLLGYGELSDGKAHVFSLPLPPSLNALQVKKRLTVTLAWLSPISPRTQKYRTASLWFEVDDTGLAPKRQNVDRHAVGRGTVQHEIFEGGRAHPVSDGDAIEIKVNCREDAGKIQAPVAYGLIVSLEVAAGVDVPVYNEISSLIKTAIPIQPTTNPGI